MSAVTAVVRKRIQDQGFCGLDDRTCAQINYPLRLSPAICMVWAAVGTALACMLATLMLIAAAWGFQAGTPMVGNIVGWALVAAAFVNVSTGFCIPSFIARIFLGKVVCR